jgi:hypothetical protein
LTTVPSMNAMLEPRMLAARIQDSAATAVLWAISDLIGDGVSGV